MRKVNVFGVPVSCATSEGIVSAVREEIRQGSRGQMLVAVNAHTYSEALKRPAFRNVLNDAFIAWPDGVPVTWAARLAGKAIGPRVHGHDLMARLLREPFSHFFYGSTPAVLREMTRRLKNVRIAGMHSPPFSSSPQSSDVSMINASGADIVWVALGAPKQELWAHLHRSRIRAPIIACVGAAFEILAGRSRRAPLSMQRAGLEWAWRLAQDPVRLWRRYLSTNGFFATHVLKHWGTRQNGVVSESRRVFPEPSVGRDVRSMENVPAGERRS